MKNKMTAEQMDYPRQFANLIEANTNFYMHTGEGGNACFSSDCDTIESVWLDGTADGRDGVTVWVPNDITLMDFARVAAGDKDYFFEYTKPRISIKCETVEDIIEAFKTVEKTLLINC